MASWPEEKLALLRKTYPYMSNAEVAEVFKESGWEITPNAAHTKAWRMGLRKAPEVRAASLAKSQEAAALGREKSAARKRGSPFSKRPELPGAVFEACATGGEIARRGNRIVHRMV